MKDKILSDLYTSRELGDLIQKMNPPHLRDDLKQELFVILCKAPESTIVSLHEKKQLRFYVTRIVLNMIASSTSPFHKMYRQYVKEVREEMDSFDLGEVESCFARQKELSTTDEVHESEHQHNNLVTAVNKCLGEMTQYEQGIFRDYVDKGSAGKMIKEMKELTGHHIPKRSILLTVKKVKEKIKKEIKAA